MAEALAAYHQVGHEEGVHRGYLSREDREGRLWAVRLVADRSWVELPAGPGEEHHAADHHPHLGDLVAVLVVGHDLEDLLVGRVVVRREVALRQGVLVAGVLVVGDLVVGDLLVDHSYSSSHYSIYLPHKMSICS